MKLSNSKKSDINKIVKQTVNRVLKEAWERDRFKYDHLTDEGNGGIEEYGSNIANLLNGLGGDPDSLHAVGETVAEMMSDADARCFIEGMAVALRGGDYQDTYKKYGITRN